MIRVEVRDERGEEGEVSGSQNREGDKGGSGGGENEGRRRKGDHGFAGDRR